MVSCPSCGELVLLDEAEAPPISQGSKDPELDPIDPIEPPPDMTSEQETRPPISLGEIEADLNGGGPAEDSPWPVQDPNQPGLDEIADYGNSEVSRASDGLLLFNVIIDGIDTNELRAAVQSVLDDKRFLWNPDGLMNSIRNGRLKITKINSIKASLLVKRLKNLDVTIRWEQYAITQMGLT
jgi:hypothetical protein